MYKRQPFKRGDHPPTARSCSSPPPVTTSLVMQGWAVALVGNVSDPPIDYAADACAVELGQSGNQLSGTLCGREFGVGL